MFKKSGDASVVGTPIEVSPKSESKSDNAEDKTKKIKRDKAEEKK